jgi:hypothetical protein
MGTGNRTYRNRQETNQSEARATPRTTQPIPRDGQTVGVPTINFDEEQRHRMIEEAAYFIAEHRGFRQGFQLDDWLAAEAEINQKPGSFQSH